MMGGVGGGAMFPFSGIFGLLILALIIVALVWLVRLLIRALIAPNGVLF